MINEHTHWAKQQFGKSDLGDPRRTARLIKLASTLANEPGKPLVNITQSPADMEVTSGSQRHERWQSGCKDKWRT